jgi:hypothetical protein
LLECARRAGLWKLKPAQLRDRSRTKNIDKATLTLAEPRRVRDRGHVRYVATQPCLVCGRSPSDAHHLRFAQSRALGRKVSDEFVVPLCRGHHRAVHRHGDEVAWWQNDTFKLSFLRVPQRGATIIIASDVVCVQQYQTWESSFPNEGFFD